MTTKSNPTVQKQYQKVSLGDAEDYYRVVLSVCIRQYRHVDLNQSKCDSGTNAVPRVPEWYECCMTLALI
eukprot:2080577-Rhodomonas_salina.2